MISFGVWTLGPEQQNLKFLRNCNPTIIVNHELDMRFTLRISLSVVRSNSESCAQYVDYLEAGVD